MTEKEGERPSQRRLGPERKGTVIGHHGIQLSCSLSRVTAWILYVLLMHIICRKTDKETEHRVRFSVTMESRVYMTKLPKMMTGHEVVVVCFYALATIDILMNASSDFYGRCVMSRLSVYSVQDLCLILSLIVFLILFFRKEILQTGRLLNLLLSNSLTFIVILVYFSLTIILQSLIITRMNRIPAGRNTNPYFWMDDRAIVFIFFAHRLTSSAYYFCFKNAVAGLSDIKATRQAAAE